MFGFIRFGTYFYVAVYVYVKVLKTYSFCVPLEKLQKKTTLLNDMNEGKQFKFLGELSL